MDGVLDKAYGKYSNGVSATSKLHQDLLHDPKLVEDYSDILNSIPRRLTEEEESSINGSVVMTKNHPARNSALSNTSSFYSVQPDSDGESGENEDDGRVALQQTTTQQEDNLEEQTQQPTHGDQSLHISESTHRLENSSDENYDYSDSDFEENLEKRLREMDDNGGQSSSGSQPCATDFFEDESSEDDLTLAGGDGSNGKAAKGEEGEQHLQQQGEDYDDSDDDGEEYQPLPPPQELDPSKLYALYAFRGPDPSHCQLVQDQSCMLLNDQDSYWWLVKRCSDGKIGFAPAEILETFPERLARLNCWKNENMSSQNITETAGGNTSGEEEKADVESEGTTGAGHRVLLQALNKSDKSVSFNDVVSYAERFIQGSDDDSDSDGDGDDEEENKNENRDKDKYKNRDANYSNPGKGQDCGLHAETQDKHKNKHAPVDKIHEERVNFLQDDDASEVVSDASFSTANMVPLQVKKMRRAEPSAEPPAETVEREQAAAAGEPPVKDHLKLADDDDLHQIFQAPSLPFSNGKEMPNSNSNYSISTIGEYSPSSSEWTNDSPQLNNNEFEVTSPTDDRIPSTRAIQDISKIVGEIQGNGGHDEKHDGEHDGTHGDGYRSPGSEKTASPPSTSPLCLGGEANTTLAAHRESVSTSSFNSCMENEHGASTTTINSTLSTIGGKFNHHPIIHELYNPIFTKIDDLMRKVEQIMDE